MTKRLLFPIALLLGLSPAAAAETIINLSPGAACRAADGALRQDGARPAVRKEAHRVDNNMIMLDEPVEGGACYLFRTEARLGANPARCPPGAVATGGGSIAGVPLGVNKCDNK